MKKSVKQFTEALAAIGCAFVIVGNRVEVTSGYVYLGSLTTLPEGVTFSNGGAVYLPSLTTLPEGVTFSNGGYVYLPSLPAGEYVYGGTTIRLECVDGYTMLILSERQIGEYSVSSARYFGGGEIKNLKDCYIARGGGYTAHGGTVAAAIRDCRFKAMQAGFDIRELVEEIKQRGTVEFNDFRLLTGACAEGLRHGMEECGLDPNAESLPLDVVMAKAHGSFGAQFKRMLA